MPMDLRIVLVLATMGSLVVSDERWVKVMSMKMVDAVEKYAALDLPNLPALASQLGLHALVNSVVKAGLADALSSPGPFTVFGPTDAAFDAIPDWLKKALDKNGTLAELLKYHVLSAKVLSSDIKDEAQVTTLLGKSMRFNIYPNNKVVTVQCSPLDLANVDKMASNGILHEITTVMIPPAGTIVDAVSACPVFKTLVTAVKAADLTGALSGKGPFTLFAPTDKAFAKLPPGTLDNLLKNITALTEILTYHVVNLTYCKAGLVSYTSLQTLNGKDINISAAGDKIKINNAFLLPEGADGSVTNGVVHAIDTVLIPPSVLLYI